MKKPFTRVVLIISGAILFILVGSFFRYLIDSTFFTYIWGWIKVIVFIFTLGEIYLTKDLTENTKLGFCFLFFAVFYYLLEMSISPIFQKLTYLCPHCSILEAINFLIR